MTPGPTVLTRIPWPTSSGAVQRGSPPRSFIAGIAGTSALIINSSGARRVDRVHAVDQLGVVGALRAPAFRDHRPRFPASLAGH